LNPYPNLPLSPQTSQTFVVTFVRGIICSYLVAIAVYMAAGAESLEGKLAAIFFPISGFVAMGMDHCIANMFLIPLGMLRGAPITIADFLLKVSAWRGASLSLTIVASSKISPRTPPLSSTTQNLLPVTLGNIVGCAFCVSYGFGSAFGKKKQKICAA
jgi:formate/nitrite transporter FocA (FNT family)